MKSLAAIAGIVILTSACGRGPAGVPPNPAAPAPAQTPAPTGPSGPIKLGQQVIATLEGHGAVHTYELTAPYAGTLTAQVTWSGSGPVALQLEEVHRQGGPPPLVASLPVEAGAKYLLRVADAAAWDYEPWRLDYMLTTAIQR